MCLTRRQRERVLDLLRDGTLSAEDSAVIGETHAHAASRRHCLAGEQSDRQRQMPSRQDDRNAHRHGVDWNDEQCAMLNGYDEI